MTVTIKITAFFVIYLIGMLLIGMALIDWILYKYRGAGFIKMPEVVRFVESIMIYIFIGVAAVFLLKNILKNIF